MQYIIMGLMKNKFSSIWILLKEYIHIYIFYLKVWRRYFKNESNTDTNLINVLGKERILKLYKALGK